MYFWMFSFHVVETKKPKISNRPVHGDVFCACGVSSEHNRYLKFNMSHRYPSMLPSIIRQRDFLYQ